MTVFFWIIFSILVGIFAYNRKGQSGILLFILSLLLSPLIGFLIAIAMPTNQKRIESRKLLQPDVKKCDQCAEIVKAEAKICKHCGHSLLDNQNSNAEE